MKLAILFSGGKDSTLALHRAVEKETVSCLITIISENKASFMFHTPNIDITKLQAEALELPLIQRMTEGKPEEELEDLKEAIGEAADDFGIEGVVTGAIESVYQAERVQRICHEKDLWCFNPLWKRDQQDLLEEILDRKFEVIISGVFAYPLDESWLGKKLDKNLVERLLRLGREYQISPSGEGGEIETTVLDAPLFRRKIRVQEATVQMEKTSGTYVIRKAGLEQK